MNDTLLQGRSPNIDLKAISSTVDSIKVNELRILRNYATKQDASLIEMHKRMIDQHNGVISKVNDLAVHLP